MDHPAVRLTPRPGPKNSRTRGADAFFSFPLTIGEAIAIVLGLMRSNVWLTGGSMLAGKTVRYIGRTGDLQGGPWGNSQNGNPFAERCCWPMRWKPRRLHPLRNVTPLTTANGSTDNTAEVPSPTLHTVPSRPNREHRRGARTARRKDIATALIAPRRRHAAGRGPPPENGTGAGIRTTPLERCGFVRCGNDGELPFSARAGYSGVPPHGAPECLRTGFPAGRTKTCGRNPPRRTNSDASFCFIRKFREEFPVPDRVTFLPHKSCTWSVLTAPTPQGDPYKKQGRRY